MDLPLFANSMSSEHRFPIDPYPNENLMILCFIFWSSSRQGFTSLWAICPTPFIYEDIFFTLSNFSHKVVGWRSWGHHTSHTLLIFATWHFCLFLNLSLECMCLDLLLHYLDHEKWSSYNENGWDTFLLLFRCFFQTNANIGLSLVKQSRQSPAVWLHAKINIFWYSSNSHFPLL